MHYQVSKNEKNPHFWKPFNGLHNAFQLFVYLSSHHHIYNIFSSTLLIERKRKAFLIPPPTTLNIHFWHHRSRIPEIAALFDFDLVFCEFISVKNSISTNFKGMNVLILMFLRNYFTLKSTEIISMNVKSSKNLYSSKIGDQVLSNKIFKSMGKISTK
jgi:hypothetical protein